MAASRIVAQYMEPADAELAHVAEGHRLFGFGCHVGSQGLALVLSEAPKTQEGGSSSYAEVKRLLPPRAPPENDVSVIVPSGGQN